jgi:hypothetical protein
MGERGRPSKEMVAEKAAFLERIERIAEPYDLTPEERTVWRAVVDDFPAHWFTPATVPMLRQYCRHTVMADDLAARINEFRDNLGNGGNSMKDRCLAVGALADLVRLQANESRVILQLATKMRLAQQSSQIAFTVDRHKKKALKPWEI